MRIVALLMLVAVVACGSSCAKTDWIQNTLVTADVTGAWTGTFGKPGTGIGNEIWLELEQQGSKVKGTYRLLFNPHFVSSPQTGPIDGTLAGDVFTFRLTDASRTGEATVNGDQMNGRLDFGGPLQLVLRRAAASAPEPR